MTRRPRKRRPRLNREKRKAKNSMQVGFGILVVIAALAGAAALFISRDIRSFNADTLCLETGATKTLSILIDSSGPLSGVQAHNVKNIILQNIEEQEIGTLVVLHEVTSSGEEYMTFAGCKPKQGREADALTENPRQIETKYQKKFNQPLFEAIVKALGNAQRQKINLENFASRAQEGPGHTQVTESELVISLDETISFPSGATEPSDNGIIAIQQIGQTLNQFDYEVFVIGHTDAAGDNEANQKLSASRAEAVKSLLIEAGMSGTQIHAEGAGELLPLASNETDAGRAKNRRVELILVRKRPIIENIQAMMVETREHSAITAEHKSIIVSDLYQNSDAYSVYTGSGWEDFKSSPNFEMLGDGLRGASVTLLRIGRKDAAIDLDLVGNFWLRYVAAQGGTIVDDRRIGDI